MLYDRLTIEDVLTITETDSLNTDIIEVSMVDGDGTLIIRALSGYVADSVTVIFLGWDDLGGFIVVPAPARLSDVSLCGRAMFDENVLYGWCDGFVLLGSNGMITDVLYGWFDDHVLLGSNGMLTIFRNQTPTLPARISKPTGELITPDEVVSIQYTIDRYSYDTIGMVRTPVTGHTSVTVPLSAISEFPIDDAFWEDMQSEETLAEPSEAYSGVRIVINPDDDDSGEFIVRVYYAGVLISTQTTNDSGHGSNLLTVDVTEFQSVTFNTTRTVTLRAGRFDFTGGATNVYGSVSSGGETIATADDYGDWCNFGASIGSAGVRGYNFIHSPNSREISAFTDPGTYEIQYRLLPKQGNPIILQWKVVVS